MNEVARVIKVIETTILRRGTGAGSDPVRTVKQYWSLEGELLAEVDPLKDNFRAISQQHIWEAMYKRKT